MGTLVIRELQWKELFAEERWLFYLLCLLVFASALTTGHNAFHNAWLIFSYEAVFVIAYLCSRKKTFYAGRLFPVQSIGFWLLACWFVSITLSLINSPYGVMTEWFAVQRYFQTLFHIVFFLCLRSFLSSYPHSCRPLLLSIAASITVLALIYIVLWNILDLDPASERYLWYIEPPLNMHIRIVDFLATPAAVLVVPFFLKRKEEEDTSWNQMLPLLCMGSIVWGFLFWCGGRGGILSACVGSLMLLSIFKVKGSRILRPAVNLVFMAGIGILLARLFAVFPWNGLGGAAERTLDSATSVYRLSNSRIDYWMSVWESLQETGSYAFGLGSQGYCYMPNRIYAFQPHNLIFQFLAEWGFVGCGLFMLLLIYGMILGVKQWLRGHRPVSIAAMAALGIILSLGIHSLVDGIFYHAQSSLYMAVAFGIWASRAAKQENRPDP